MVAELKPLWDVRYQIFARLSLELGQRCRKQRVDPAAVWQCIFIQPLWGIASSGRVPSAVPLDGCIPSGWRNW